VRVSELERRRRSRSSVNFHFFAECPRSGTRQRFFKNLKIGFAECHGSGTGQRLLCRVPTNRHSTKNGLRVFRNTMSSATWLALGKDFFAECPSLHTRQSIFLFFKF
jgi:hypothetical protein